MQVRAVFQGALCAVLWVATGVASAITLEPYWQSPISKDKEGYITAPMPAGVQVVNTENEGPVFATADGKTLYSWPLSGLRNGQAGDRRKSGLATCDGTIYKETSGFLSPYPGGFLLPEPENRKSCEALWPPFLAPADAKPVGKWTIVKRTNGESQWAYDDFPRLLEHHPRDRRRVGGGALGEGDAARVGLIEPGDQPQQRALAASAASDDGDELAGGDMEIEFSQHPRGAETFGKAAHRHRRPRRHVGSCRRLERHAVFVHHRNRHLVTPSDRPGARTGTRVRARARSRRRACRAARRSGSTARRRRAA